VLRHRAVAPEELIPAFANYASKVQRKGLMAVEDDIAEVDDSFLARALTLTVTGMGADLVRHALEIEARVCAERDEEQAQVIEAAAGYAPTLGVVGAVLGLMHVMQRLSASGDVGVGIAAAFVATVYGVGAANLVFLPLATRLRARARLDVLRRELTIDGIMALRDGMHPSLVEDRLAGYLQHAASRPTEAA
jgi:chemotaxis protein MotA